MEQKVIITVSSYVSHIHQRQNVFSTQKPFQIPCLRRWPSPLQPGAWGSMKAGLRLCQTATFKSCRRQALKLQTDLFHGFLYYFPHSLSCSRTSLLSREKCIHPSMELHRKKPCLCCYQQGANQCSHRLSPLAGICLISLPSLPVIYLWIQEALH